MALTSKQFILAIDIGTSSVRAALYDQKGGLIKGTLVKYERHLRQTADGGSEIDADGAFRQVIKTIDDVLRLSTKIKGEITHVAACAFWHSLVGIDARGKPTTKVLSWADNRSREQVAVLRKKLDENDVHGRTGARFHSSFWPAKILCIRKTRPEVFARTAMWMSLSDYIQMRLCDSPGTSVSMASATGMLDIRECLWDKQLSKFLKIKQSSLPKIADDDDTFHLNNKFAKRWPRLADAKWFPAIGDGAANNIGSGCTTTKHLGLMVGTSGAMRVAYRGGPPKKLPSGLWCYRIDRERVVVGGALSDGGGLFEWLQTNLNLSKNFERAVARRTPDQPGLTFLPFLAGERSTGYHENARGAIIGLSSSTTAIDIAQAAMESVCYRFAEIFDQIKSVVKVDEIVASGGALQSSRVWTQMLADILGLEITLVDVPEASLRGAVLLALESIGNIESIEDFSSAHGKSFVPNITKCEAYKRPRLEHQRLYELLLNKD
jgi:gluconokinase